MTPRRKLTGVLAAIGLFLLCVSTARADSPLVGSWKLSYVAGLNNLGLCILQIEEKDGKLSGKLLSGNPRMQGLSLGDLKADGENLRAVIKLPTTELTFEGKLLAKNGKIMGSLGDERIINPAEMTRTEKVKLDNADLVSPSNIPALQEALKLQNQTIQLSMKARQTQDADEKAKLNEQIREAAKEAQTRLPELFKEAVEKHANDPGAINAALNLIRMEARNKPPADEVRKWVNNAVKAAEPHGPRLQWNVDVQLAEVLINQPGLESLALERASRAEKVMGENAAPAHQVRVLTVLNTALRKSGKTEEEKAIQVRLAKIETKLDDEYLAKMPPFKGEAFAGRNAASDRAVVMELFTGAQCPPCVAADVAFDVLQKTYKPSELILIQYHLHIPGPDPLTNADSEARFDYYRKHFAGQIGGTPTTIFNGNPEAGGGGNLAMAQQKYNQYRAVINPLLEEPAKTKLKATASMQGSKINIRVDVSGVEDAENKRLRLVLVEENVRYVGSNALRFHHQVVRALPGGAEGFELKNGDSKHSAVVDLKELREKLSQYLDDFSAKRGPFPNPNRPMDMKKLRIIALVQDDKTAEILQAVQVEPEENAAE